MSKFTYFTNARWRTAAILEIEKLQYLGNRSSDRDEILHEKADHDHNRAEGENLHILKIQDGGPPLY